MNLRISKLLLAFVLASLAVLLMSSLVMAAPSTVNIVNNGPSPLQSPIMTPTVPFTHPVGLAISTFFSSSFGMSYTVSYSQVMAMHESGLGFGVIARVYLTALATKDSDDPLTPEGVLALFQDGMGWGQIAKETGVHPGGNGLGTIMSNGKGNKPDCTGNGCNAPEHESKPDKPDKPAKPEKPAKPAVAKGPKK